MAETAPVEGAVETAPETEVIEGMTYTRLYHPERQQYLDANPLEGYEELEVVFKPTSENLLMTHVEKLVDWETKKQTILWNQESGEVWVAIDPSEVSTRRQGFRQAELGYARYEVKYETRYKAPPEKRLIRDSKQSKEVALVENYDLISDPFHTGNENYSPEIGTTVADMIEHGVHYRDIDRGTNEFDNFDIGLSLDNYGQKIIGFPDQKRWAFLDCQATPELAAAIGHNARIYRQLDGPSEYNGLSQIVVPFEVTVG